MHKANLEIIKTKIQEAKQASPSKDDITLVAVVKNRTNDEINSIIKAGATEIAENRVQALRDRGEDILPAKRHIIGHLQTNKAKLAVSLADMIQSIDSIHLLKEVGKAASSLNKNIEVLFQINIANEATKFGAPKKKLNELIQTAGKIPNITVRGLMAIMPIETKLLYYKEMYEIFLDNREKIMHNIYNDNIHMDFLSMGMSGDFLQAISCGANMVRLGHCLFEI